ncbi:MAG: hypothetical protein AABW73_01695 [Nanoarchaeota archaeon]
MKTEWTHGGRREVSNKPKKGYDTPQSLEGWDYVLARDGETVLCAYNPQMQELRVNNDTDNDLGEIIADLDERPGCADFLVSLLSLRRPEPTFEREFGVTIDERLYSRDGRLVKAGVLKPEQKQLVRSGGITTD